MPPDRSEHLSRDAQPRDVLPSGTRLGGRYELVDVIGRGGMGVVYRAWDVQLEVVRALKVMTPSDAAKLSGVQAQLRARFEVEAKTMAKLAGHPNIVSVHDMGDTGGDVPSMYFVMDFVAGGTVMDRVQRYGPLPPQMAAGVIRGVLRALKRAHGLGIVHRDIKPHNILIDLDGIPKVSDFGIARVEESTLTQTSMQMGTAAYMSPEQRRSARRAGPQSDLYATGAALYALLTGREPMHVSAADTDAHDYWEGVPDPLRAFIRRATAFDPNDRFADAQTMLEALDAAVSTLESDPDGPGLLHQEVLPATMDAATHTPNDAVGNTLPAASYGMSAAAPRPDRSALDTTPVPTTPSVWGIGMTLGAVALLGVLGWTLWADQQSPGGVAATAVARWESSSGLLPDAIACAPWAVDDTARDDEPVLGSSGLLLRTGGSWERLGYLHTHEILEIPDTVVIEARLRVERSTPNNETRAGAGVHAHLAVPGVRSALMIGTGEVFLLAEENIRGPAWAGSTDDVAHTYRMEIDTKTLQVDVYRDDRLILEGTAFVGSERPNANEIGFGELSMAASGASHWTYVTHNALSGAVDCR